MTFNLRYIWRKKDQQILPCFNPLPPFSQCSFKTVLFSHKYLPLFRTISENLVLLGQSTIVFPRIKSVHIWHIHGRNVTLWEIKATFYFSFLSRFIFRATICIICGRENGNDTFALIVFNFTENNNQHYITNNKRKNFISSSLCSQ